MSSTGTSRRTLIRAAQVLGTAVLFALAETFGRLFTAEPGVFVLFPATAVAIVATMWFGGWGALGVFLGSISSEGFATVDTELIVAGIIAVSEGLIPWAIFRTRRALSRDLRDVRSLAAFLLFGTLLNTAVNAIAGNLFVLHHSTSRTFWQGVFVWWLSDFSAAILLATPAIAFGGQLVKRLRSGRAEHPRTVANALQIVTVVTILGFAGAVGIRAWLQHRVEGDRLQQQQKWISLQATLSKLHHNALSSAFVDTDAPGGDSRNAVIKETHEKITLDLLPLLIASGAPLSRHVKPLQERSDALFAAWDAAAKDPSKEPELGHRAHELAAEIVVLRDEADRLNVLAWQNYTRQRTMMITAASILDAIVLVILALSFTTILLNVSRPFMQIRDGIDAIRDGKPFDTEVSSPYLEFRSISEALARTSRELHEREEELRRETERAVSASRHKTDFLAKMSHELRTPLNSIIGFSELLVEQETTITTAKRLAFLDNVMNSAHHLLKLINDLLDISKIESGKMSLHIQPIDVRMAVANTVASTTPLFHRKRQKIEVDVPHEPLMIEADIGRLEQVLLNLLSNANKFAPEGDQISIRARAAGHLCVIEVQDHGIGIPEEAQSRIFHEFEQVETSGGEHSTGTGLGLALARRFIEAHGGSIGVESRVGAGSIFRVTLPVSGATHGSLVRL